MAIDGGNQSVSLTLNSPPQNDYTLAAWVYLKSGGSFFASRVAVINGADCGDSVELLVRGTTETDAQYLELGRCGAFNGVASTIPVPLNTWTHIAATVDAANLVTYFVNGQPAGSWSASTRDVSLGTHVNLGANSGARLFNGMLDEVQIWSRTLSSAEVRAVGNLRLTGNEPGLYAYYACEEESGTTLGNAAAEHLASNGTLLNGVQWVGPGVPTHSPAIIGTSGIQPNLGPAWRTRSVPKPLDIDADDILGSDGYILPQLGTVLPAYIGSMEILVSTYPGNGGYALLDDPANPESTVGSATLNPAPGPGAAIDLLRFGVGPGAAGRSIRVGLMVDNLDAASFNGFGVELHQLGGVNGTVVETKEPAFNNRIPDWIFFDITQASDGDVFVVRGIGGINGVATLGGVTFDSIGFPLVNQHGVTISDHGAATPYPSRIVVTNLPDTVVKLTVTLSNLSHSAPQDLDILLVGPQGQTAMLLSDAGGLEDIHDLTLTFDDAASGLADDLHILKSGALHPTDFLHESNETLPPPAPPGPYQAALSVFNGTNPNGVWSLYVRDIAAPDGGSLAGWSLSVSALDSHQHVTQLGDNGPGSLREAIANLPPGGGVVDFPRLAGTIHLTGGEITVDRDTTLVGPGASKLTLSADSLSRLFRIPAGVTVNISGLTLANGRSPKPSLADVEAGNLDGHPGGAIHNAGILTLDDCVLTQNQSGTGSSKLIKNGPELIRGSGGVGGAIYNVGELTIHRSTFSTNRAGSGQSVDSPTGGRGGHGGAIYNAGSLIVIASTLSDNMAGSGGDQGSPTQPGGHGGAIFNAGSLSMTSCTLAGNRAGTGGSARRAGKGGDGGAIYNVAAVDLVACTLSANKAGSGGLGILGPGSTLFGPVGGDGGDAGAIHNMGSCSLKNTLIAQNSAGEGGQLNGIPTSSSPGKPGLQGQIDEALGIYISRGHNLLASPAGTMGLIHDQNGDLVGPFDTRIGPLADNGGPTLTMALLPGSPAVAAGDDTLLNLIEQRGSNFPRQVGRHIDIGAIESNFVGPSISDEFPLLRTTDPVTLLDSFSSSATIDPDSFPTRIYVEYGVTSNYGAASPAIEINQANAGVKAALTIPLLLSHGPGYHYRWVAQSRVDVTFGPDRIVPGTPGGIPGDGDGDGIVSPAEFAAVVRVVNGTGILAQPEVQLVLSNYWAHVPQLLMTNVLGLGQSNVLFEMPSPILDGFGVEVSTDLADWQKLGPAIRRYEFLDTNSPAAPQRYYRLVSPGGNTP